MNNYYQALGVARDATPAVVKIAYEGQLKALERAGLGEAQRKAEEKLLSEAFVTLSNPAKKSWYDAQLERDGQRERAGASGRRAIAIVAAVALVLAGSAAYYFNARASERERLRLEEQRIALERDKAARQSEIEIARIRAERESQESARSAGREGTGAVVGVIRDINTEQGRRFDRVMDTGDQRYRDAKAARDRREERYAEDRARRQADEDLRKARAEVERQKRFVAEREREEERVRNERHRQSQRR